MIMFVFLIVNFDVLQIFYMIKSVPWPQKGWEPLEETDLGMWTVLNEISRQLMVLLII